MQAFCKGKIKEISLFTGPFATVMDQGIDPAYGPGHIWFAHANPTGYGN